MPMILNRYTGIRKCIKNLNWLLKHAWEVSWFEVDFTEDGGADLFCALAYHNYYTHFANKELCWKFLHRPSFYGRDLKWNGKTNTILQYNQNLMP